MYCFRENDVIISLQTSLASLILLKRSGKVTKKKKSQNTVTWLIIPYLVLQTLNGNEMSYFNLGTLGSGFKRILQTLIIVLLLEFVIQGLRWVMASFKCCYATGVSSQN